MVKTMQAYRQNLAPSGNNESTIVITIETDERTPLLRGSKKNGTKRQNHSKDYCDFLALAIVVMLVGGLSIATYLLVVESRSPSVSFALDLVDRGVWTEAVIPLGRSIADFEILHVLLMQTGGETCTELYGCIDILRDMQNDTNTEIPFNFLIGGDGQTYEARGWNHESGINVLPQQSSLVIGFMGNYTSSPPTEVQCTSALSIIHESLQRKKLHSSYQVFGLRNLSISSYDGEALFDRISKWQRFVTLLNVV